MSTKLTLDIPPVEKLPTEPEELGAAASAAIKTLTGALEPYYKAREQAIIAMLEGNPKGKPPRAPMRPADVARVIGVTRAFMSRYKSVVPK